MSRQDFVDFLRAVQRDPDKCARYDAMTISQVLFHAKNEGYRFTIKDVDGVVGALESTTITAKDGEPIDGDSTLWRSMWGRRHLDYLVNCVVSRFDEAELVAIGS